MKSHKPERHFKSAPGVSHFITETEAIQKTKISLIRNENKP